jgi:hypothetical protein
LEAGDGEFSYRDDIQSRAEFIEPGGAEATAKVDSIAKYDGRCGDLLPSWQQFWARVNPVDGLILRLTCGKLNRFNLHIYVDCFQ